MTNGTVVFSNLVCGVPYSVTFSGYSTWTTNFLIPSSVQPNSYGEIGAYGYQGTYTSGFASNTIDSLNLTTAVWDAPGTNIYTGGTTLGDFGTGSHYAVVVAYAKSARKFVWKDTNNWYTWTPGAPSATDTGDNSTSPYGSFGRYPIAFDSSRDQFFNLQYSNGQDANAGGSDPNWHATAVSGVSGTPVKHAVTFNPSAAWTQLQADKPCYASMDYDRLKDVFMFTAGGTFATGGTVLSSDSRRVYVIRPNAGYVWDVEFFTFGPGGDEPGTLSSNGLQQRFQYVERGGYGGWLMLMNGNDYIHYLATTRPA
jgi:hypothetical protein